MAHVHRLSERWGVAAAALLLAIAGCGAGESDVDPGDLSMRDLLGVDPQVGLRWNARERASARRVLARALAEEPEAPRDVPLGFGSGASDRALAALAALDHELAENGAPPVAATRVDRRDAMVRLGPYAADLEGILADPAGDAATLRLRGWDDWPGLAPRASQIAPALASAAEHPPGEPLNIEAAPRAAVAVAYLSDERTLLVNPVLVAALDPRASDPPPAAAASVVAPVNPYDFYGSVSECAAAERTRCQACLSGGGCEAESRDAPDGTTECQMLDADGGRGYYLFCANLALAIASVSGCVDARTSGCPVVESAGNQISALEANASIVFDPVCLAVLDGCLSDLYGAPDGNFPGPPGSIDAGPQPPPPPPRDFRGCTDCSGNDCNVQCNKNGADTCDCNGCTTTCDSSGDGGGGGGDSCSCGDGGGSSGGGGSDCSCSKDSMGNESCTCGDGADACTCDKDMEGNQSCSCGEGSGGGGGSSGGGDGCGDCGSGGSGGSSGGSGCGSCGSSGSGGSSGGSGCGSSGGSGCRVAPARTISSRTIGLAVTIGWGFLPVVVLLVVRRRAGGRR